MTAQLVMTLRTVSSMVVISLALLSSACSSTVEVACTLIGIDAITVRVRDAATGAYIAGGATLVTRKDSVSRTTTWADVRARDADAIPSLFFEPGVFDVTVRKAGYQDWARSGVRVEGSGDCDQPVTVRLEASLERLP